MVLRLIGGIGRAAAKAAKGSKRRGGRGGSMTIKGVRLDMARLEFLMDAVPERADRIVEESARAIEAGAKIAAPVDTGALRGSITVEDTGDASRRIGPTMEYSAFIELGTRRSAPRPFLKPAFDDEAPNLKKRLKGIVK